MTSIGFQRTCVVLLTCVLAIAGWDAALNADDGATEAVTVLKHPYPYSASVSVLSDLHSTTVEDFEAVHLLVNSRDLIERGSAAWDVLGLEQSVAPELGHAGIRGFGLPFADTFWAYDETFGFFADYDTDRNVFIRHRNPDLEPIFARWYEEGYIDSLHTFGKGSITRSKSEAFVSYFRERFEKPLTVHVNHSKATAPSGVGQPCCTLLNQTLVHLRWVVYSLVGWGDRLALPKQLPDDPLPGAYALLALSALSGLGLVAGWWLRGARRVVWMVLLTTLAVAPVMWLQTTWVDFYRGDNPDSEYYNRDLLADLGIRFYWDGDSDIYQGVVESLELPETVAPTGRPTIFRVREFGDGTKGLLFMRATKGGGPDSLDLLEEANLRRLVKTEGRSVIYLHWLEEPMRYFDAEGLANLASLRSFTDRKLIWSAPASRLLAQSYAYSYVDFESSVLDGIGVVTINGFEDPIRGNVKATLDELQDLSFRCPSCQDLDVKLGDRRLADHQVDKQVDGDGIVLTITARS